MDDKTILDFATRKRMPIFIEELDPVIEEETKLGLFENRMYIPTYGKRNGYVPSAGEPDVDKVKKIILDITRKEVLLVQKTL
ncbi:hypothetical protein OTJ99_001157 [Caldicellulosiruptor naganoensis]|uniref:Uncharacterized protein n=1 Tax=Caldicellulosiruptor naganoensis TaxID=29324 RepID=A0ABY7BL10_9FIRM|nr:hypothetical protein [Caldicellulosiruptor naganoensis]WAM32582.1 hypothetical protein OTJ99_001157 [Caldicellulosiruptor naganoensis]